MAQIEVYIISSENIDRDTGIAKLSGPEAHHLLRVRRGKAGDQVVLIDGAGNAWHAQVALVSKDTAHLTLLEYFENWREPPVQVHLGLGVLKKDRFTQALELAVALGVYNVTPLLTRYVVASWSDTRSERANRVAVAATKQCGRGYLPEISNAKPLHRWCIEHKDFNHKLLLSTDGEKLPYLGMGDEIALAVGCEGGFSEDEEEWMIENGFTPVSLGLRRLRSEAAVASILSQIMSQVE
ncbi:16S rRNA (uracil(1498)-N(3))-methyltransferase [bacterium]|nr:16S rRNA (uracil(1498)-N(3))-methyltransferase [bacterium]